MKRLPCLPRGHHQQDIVIPHSSVPCSEPALAPAGSGMVENVSCCTAASIDGSYKCCFSYHKVDPGHLYALNDTGEYNILDEKQMLKPYCTTTNLVLSLLYLFCFPGHFFPSLTHLRDWLAPFSLPISTHIYNFHDCSLREFLTQTHSE